MRRALRVRRAGSLVEILKVGHRDPESDTIASNAEKGMFHLWEQ
jgi:hypothetical protein